MTVTINKHVVGGGVEGGVPPSLTSRMLRMTFPRLSRTTSVTAPVAS
jgi:hypothetical protein